MTIEKWLSDVYQDSYVGNKIWNKTIDGGSEMIADIRGWGAIQYLFKNNEEAKKFQNEVCKFIVEAIREKLANISSQTEISDEEIEKEADKYANKWIDGKEAYYGFKECAKWYKEQLKQKTNGK